jgi:hypothetical protein
MKAKSPPIQHILEAVIKGVERAVNNPSLLTLDFWRSNPYVDPRIREVVGDVNAAIRLISEKSGLFAGAAFLKMNEEYSYLPVDWFNEELTMGPADHRNIRAHAPGTKKALFFGPGRRTTKGEVANAEGEVLCTDVSL